MIRENAPYYIERGPIFPGKSCFPLSPGIKSGPITQFPKNSNDQLSVIFDVLGTPNESDVIGITSSKALKYINSFAKKEKKNFQILYPGSTRDEIEILQKMLAFDKEKRICLDELLEHSYFQEIRNTDLETLPVFNADFEFDRENELDIEQMKAIFMNHIE